MLINFFPESHLDLYFDDMEADMGFVSLHQRDTMVFPNFLNVYGSVVFDFSRIAAFEEADVYIKETQNRGIDKPAGRCSTDGKANLSVCLADYVEKKVDCSTGMMGGSRARPLCSSKEQLKTWHELTNQIRFSDANDVFAKTGCLASCESRTFEYKLRTGYGLGRFKHFFTYGEVVGYRHDIFSIFFFFLVCLSFSYTRMGPTCYFYYATMVDPLPIVHVPPTHGGLLTHGGPHTHGGLRNILKEDPIPMVDPITMVNPTLIMDTIS